MTLRHLPSRRGGRLLLLLGPVLVPTAAALAAVGAGGTTVARTIGDPNGDNRLEYTAGEPHVVRSELAAPKPGRAGRRVPRIVFAQQTDLHVIDEESPLRLEFVDKVGPPLTSAYRPQEGLSPQGLESMTRQLRSARSPITGRSLDVVMTTGDNSDNTQLNETRLFIDTLDGGRTVDPNSGVPGTCATDPNGPRYAGVRGGGEFYEPDASGPGTDGPGYAPAVAENLATAGRSSAVRDFPGLFEEMNLPFRTTGLGVPWYGIFGNHDGLIQGNQPRNPALEAFATGCVKVTGLSPQGILELRTILASGAAPATLEGQISTAVIADAVRTAGAAVLDAARARIVPSDPARRPLRKAEYIAQHFLSAGRPWGHGFTAENVRTAQGNYSVSPRPGVRFLVLDSMSETGGADGNIDDPQFRWLHDQLVKAEARKELTFAFAHHSVRTLVQQPVSGFAPGDQGGEATPLVHFGGADETEPCPLSDPVSAPTLDETLRCLFLRHPGLIAYVSGHEHINRITPFERPATGGQAGGGFWEISTAAHIDWPQQSRVIDLLDNRDGTLSIVGSVVDHSAPPTPEAAVDRVARLAAIDRELSFNDPDAANGEDGSSDARGAREDRNVELLVRHPYGS